MHDRLTYSIEQAAAVLGISRAKAYRSVQAGELHAVPFGRRLVVPAQVVDAILGLGERHATPPDVINEVQVTGRLTRPPEGRTTRTGNPMATLRIAVGAGEHPVFINVVAFGKLAAEVCTLTKGQRVGVTGRLDQRDWTTQEGLHRSTHQIVARRVEALQPPERRSAPTASRATGSEQCRTTAS